MPARCPAQHARPASRRRRPRRCARAATLCPSRRAAEPPQLRWRPPQRLRRAELSNCSLTWRGLPAALLLTRDHSVLVLVHETKNIALAGCSERAEGDGSSSASSLAELRSGSAACAACVWLKSAVVPPAVHSCCRLAKGRRDSTAWTRFRDVNPGVTMTSQGSLTGSMGVHRRVHVQAEDCSHDPRPQAAW